MTSTESKQQIEAGEGHCDNCPQKLLTQAEEGGGLCAACEEREAQAALRTQMERGKLCRGCWGGYREVKGKITCDCA